MESKTTGRLRKAFRYIADSDSDSLPDHLDEEEQDALIARFVLEDTRQNTLYTRLFTALYLVPILNSLFHLTSRHASALEFLSLTSYVLTTYSIYFVPIRPSPSKAKGKEKAKATESLLSRIGFADSCAHECLEDLGPVNRFLPFLNLLLAATIAVGHFVGVRREKKKGVEVEFYEEYIGYLPLLLLIMSIIIRRVMASVDVTELEEKRYKYKGA